MAIEMAIGCVPPPLGILVRNLALALEFLYDHPLHLHLLAGPDYSAAMVGPTNPSLLARAPVLYRTFSGGIRTNLPLSDAIKLAVLVRSIPQENIKNRVIDTSMVGFGNVILGGQNASVMKPLPDKIRILRDEIFTAGGPASPLADDPLRSLVRADAARLRLLNATTTPELETRTRIYLSQKGMLVTETGEIRSQSRTVVVLYSPKLYTLKFLIDIFRIDRSTQILIKRDPAETVDIEVQLGDDWASSLPADFEKQPEHFPKDLP